VRFPEFVGGTYQSFSHTADAQRTVNLIPELIESNAGKNRYGFYGRPGLVEFANVGSGPMRCLWAGDERLFVVSGSTLYEVSSGGTGTSLGSVGSDAWPAQIFSNGLELFIISGGQAYSHNGVDLASAPVPADPYGLDGTPAAEEGTASVGAFIDNYFIAAKPDSSTFFYSAQRDGRTWSALDFLVKEGYPDHIESLITSHSELWTLGDQTSEIWRNEGDADNLLRRDPSGFVHQGIVARASVARFDNGIAWLGGDTSGRCIAWRTRGFSPQRISTHAIENAWAGYATVSDAIGFSFVWKGHSLYVITFPTADKTWVYDVSTNLWHEWQSGSGRFRGRNHCFVFGKHLVGDHTSGKIYELSDSTYTDAGSAITWQRTAPYIHEEQKNLFFHDLKLELETGLASSQNYTLEWSVDGGKNWSDPITAAGGPVDNFNAQMQWRRLGGGRDRIFRITSTANCKQAWMDAYLRVTAGAH
jgi:hypothetical protein